MVLKNTIFVTRDSSTAESIQRTTLPLERIHDIHSGHSLATGVLCICDSVTDDILEEHLKDPTGLFVDQACHT